MRPLVIGHAAAAGEAPANTLAGVRASLASADAMEIDVQLSADGIPVLMHDLTVDRTTNLSGRVSGFTAAQLALADAGAGEPVPTLQQVLELVAGRLTVMCELKVDRSAETDVPLVDAVHRVISAAGAERWAAVHSFDPEIVRAARQRSRAVSAAIISPAVDAAGMQALADALLERNGQAVSVEHSCLAAGLVAAAHRRQLMVWAWTADSQADWSRLIAAGVDGIITNVPARLRAFLEQ